MAITTAIVMFILYIVSHYNLAGIVMDSTICEKLSEKLQTKVEIGQVEVNWLNQIGMNDIVVFDQKQDTLFKARRATISLEVIPLLQKKLTLNTIQLIDFNLAITKDSLEGKPNYDFIVEAIMPKDEDNQQRKFINDISLNALLLRQGTVSYDVKDQVPSKKYSLPDQNHLLLQNVSASLAVSISHISGLNVKLKRMAMHEKSGCILHEMKGIYLLSADTLQIPDWSAKFSRQLADGTLCEVVSKGDLRRLNDSLDMNSHVTVDAGSYAKINAKLACIVPLDSLQNIRYSGEFKPSKLSIQAIDEILALTETNLPKEAEPWIKQINSFAWTGTVEGESLKKITYNGNLSTNGTLDGQMDVEADYSQGEPLYLRYKGDINSFLYQNHLYRDLKLDGRYAQEKLSTDINILDPLCDAHGHADIDFSHHATHIESYANLVRFNPYALNLTELENLKDLTFRGIVATDIKIPDQFDPETFIEKLFVKNQPLPEGFVEIESLGIKSNDEAIDLGRVHMTLQQEQGIPVFAFISQVGKIVGTPTSVIAHIPTNLQFDHIIKMPGEFTKDVTFQSEWDSIGHQLSVELMIPEWKNGDNLCTASLKAKGKTQANSPIPEHMDAILDFAYNTPTHKMESNMAIDYVPDPLLLSLNPSTLILDGKTFKTSKAKLKQEDDGSFSLKDFTLQDEDKSLTAAGTFGNNQGVNIKILLDNWQLDFFLDMLHKGYLDFGGYASGEMTITSDSVLHLETQSLAIKQFNYIGTNLGTGNLEAFYDFENSHLNIGADIETYPKHMTRADCEVMLHDDRDTMDLRVQLDSLPLDFVSYWIDGAIQDLHGHGTGFVRLYGDCDSLNLVGDPLLQNINFTHDLLGARFYVTDTINMSADEETGAGFVGLDNITLRDRNGQQAVLTLDLEHHRLHNMEYGLDLDIPENSSGFLVYDQPNQKEGDLYWGRLWATGRCQMHGTSNKHRINLQMAPAGRSTFNLSPGEENFADNEYNFLTFRDKKQFLESEENLEQLFRTNTFEKKKEDDEPTYVEADLLIHANDHCQVYIQMDPLAEDRLICRGNGDLALHYDTHHDINLTGNYDITSGSYTVTMKGDVMTKAFQLQQGSRVSFPGSPKNAELNLNAVYNIPSANLRDLDESFVSVANLSRTTLPVDCKLNVTGPITAPQIAFDLEVKNTSEDIQALVHNIIGTQEMLNREVFYLLLFSKFYTPEYASTSQRQTGSELTSFASSSLTSQLNNLLGHMSDNFTLGTNFRSDKGDFSDMEMDVSVSTRLLNDRLLMTGNLGYRDPANSVGINTNNTNFIGDFDVEFLINTKGTVRAKAYSHYNDRDYSINNALTTQGIGIILRKDFKTFSDLLKRKQQIAK